MARYGASILSQAAQLSGAPSGTTVNGYMGYWGAGSSAGFRLRRMQIGVIAGASVPTSQQISVGVFRQTVAPAGTGIASAIPGQAMEIWTPTDPTAGLFAITATTIGTTGPTIATNPITVLPLNTQSTLDLPYEFVEELICNSGTANGFAFVNIGNTLPASHQIRLSVEIEV
ncbi:MAG: hypothetical protein HOV66_03040 [Streptomycetaceae bacterium]|nr:hypothetical protein [Streptomycetaceae bacterium]